MRQIRTSAESMMQPSRRASPWSLHWSKRCAYAVALLLPGIAQASEEKHPSKPDEGDGETPTEAIAPREPKEPDGMDRALATGAAIVPGIVIHGAGSWVLGDDEAAQRLLLIEGAGAGLIVGSLTGLATTGAARALVGAFAVTGLAGFSLFSLSLLADVYHSAAPANGWGEPRRTPFFMSRLAWVQVEDPQFRYHDFVSHGFRFQPGAVGIGFEAWHAPGQGNGLLRLEPSLRLWEASPRWVRQVQDGSFLELVFAASRHQFDDDDFVVSTYELELRHRLDTERVVPTIRGAFTEFHVGYALTTTRFEAPSSEDHGSLLLGGFGFGTYLGSAQGEGGEAVVYYDHRHDGFAAGLKVPGVGSGVLGHFGLRGHYYLNETLGIEASIEAGSAYVIGTGIRVRVDR